MNSLKEGKVRLGLLLSHIRLEEKLLIQRAQQRRDIELSLVDSRELVLHLENQLPLDVLLDREISQSRALHALQLLQSSGIKAINSYETARVGGDKLLTSVALHNAGVPTPRVRVTFTPESTLHAIEEMGYPVVLKPVDGSWGRLMAKIESRTAAEAILEHKSHLNSYFHSVFYIQEWIEKPGRDIRAFVIDGETICAAYRVSEHWLTNAARGGRTVECPVTSELHEICMRAAQAVGGECLAVDLMEEVNSGYIVHEVNCAMEFKESLKAVKTDIPARIIDYCVRAARRAPQRPKRSKKELQHGHV